MNLLPLILLSPILVFTAFSDLKYLRIPNSLSLIAVSLFICTAPLLSLEEFGLRIAIAATVFIIGFIGFVLGLIGGGDVKILAALMLFIPSQTLQLFSLAFSAALILGILFVLLLRATPRPNESSFEAIRSPGKFPMGISIALVGLFHPVLVWVAA